MPPCDANRKFLEESRAVREREILAAAEAARQIADDLGIGAGVAGRIDCLLNMNDARLHVGGDPSSSSCRLPARHDIGMHGRFRKEEIDHAEKFQLPAPRG